MIFDILATDCHYSASIARLLGSINAAIMLNKLSYWWTKKNGDTLYKTIEEMEDETALTRPMQDKAIDILKQHGLLWIEIHGVPPKRHFVVNVEAINALKPNLSEIDKLRENNKLQDSNLSEIDKSICRKSTNQFVGNRQILYRSNITPRNTYKEGSMSKRKVLTHPPYDEIVELFNRICHPPLHEVKRLNPDRRGKINARWREGLDDLKQWECFFRYVVQSPFLAGEVKPRDGGKPFKATFDWILKPSNYTKIYEDHYHD